MDDFKVVNDCYGHDYGDGILKSFAAFLNTMFSEPNKVFRFGGDEFVILINHENIGNVADYLRILLERSGTPWQALDKQFYCTLSIGVVEFSGKDEEWKTIIKHADIAMYEAKRRGKNNYEYYQSRYNDKAVQRSRMESLLRKAMNNNFEGFEVHYQPIVSAESGNITGMEALLRMYDYDNIILPNEFIPLAEYLGFMIPIGEYVLRSAARECMKINQTGQKDFSVTINLSAKQFNQKEIVNRIENILDDTGVDYRNIIISISESIAVGDSERMFMVCKQLRSRGIQIALDNFGGGNSSFLHLRDLPIDIIKISSVFVQTINEEYSREFIEIIIKLSRSMHKKICINGIETEFQYEQCKTFGAVDLQGFYLYRPAKQSELKMENL
ncbi:bifunctional diguanylate cyclase/phosphodiesterase [Brucepastera parasyntrophica]|uniref:putative bifunctional diguanylate cyclase/phosphodiesterase n=1 Tax=Brucepastera parasyntrophica TaxID=2880008 RepID=UPI002109FBA7|nr:bifunctional diguanylate cyclase/phosphodiesterase [Brucepastera parasyntrophica]ULQ60850.1 bifunctional diguanylate cyclase/phosphodiesterase [Brucepastera parasyntrophica]